MGFCILRRSPGRHGPDLDLDSLHRLPLDPVTHRHGHLVDPAAAVVLGLAGRLVRWSTRS